MARWREVFALNATVVREARDARTVVRVGSHSAIVLPEPDHPDRDGAVERLAVLLRTVRENAGVGLDIDAKIRTIRRSSTFVTHGDVMAVLDAFMRSGVTDVHYEGTAGPVPHSASGFVVGG